MHAGTFDLVEYVPSAHAVHALAPALVPVFVIEPAEPTVHDATFDAVEYRPGAHSVHVVAPALTPVFVIEPAGHC